MDNLPLPLKIKINILLRAKQFIQARDLVTSKQSFGDVTENGMDLITQICDHGLNETEEWSEIAVCSEMLIYIAKYFGPKLAIIAFLEQAEAFNFSSKFSVFVQPLQIILSRTENKKPSTVAWILKVLNLHLKTFYAYPETVKNKYNDEEANLIIHNDPEARQILSYYQELCNFYDMLVAEILSIPENPDTTVQLSQTKRILRDNLIDLLGPPLVYMNLSWSSVDNPSTVPYLSKVINKTTPRIKSEARLIVEKLMDIICRINTDSSHFINWIEEKELKEGQQSRVKKYSEETNESNEEYDTMDDSEDIVEPHLYSVANYMYLIYSEKLGSTDVPPPIYSLQYIFCTSLFIINKLLTNSQQHPCLYLKGIQLAHGIVEQTNSFSPFTANVLDLPLHSEFLERLTHLVVFCESRSVRLAGIKLFTKYLWSFEASGKYNLLNQLFNTVKHSGLFGHCITQLKEFIRLALNEKIENNQNNMPCSMQEYFVGSNLIRILQPLCNLENGVETNLVNSSDKIIALLNLLRYLFIRDASTNLSGIGESLGHIEHSLLKPLRTGLDLSKAHYESRLKEVNEAVSFTGLINQKNGIEFSVTLDGDEENNMEVEGTKENQLMVLNSALSVLSLLEALLARVNETCMIMALKSHKLS